MRALDLLVLRVKRAETPFYRRLNVCVKRLARLRVPTPRPLMPPLRLLYEFHLAAASFLRRASAMFYAEPLFRSRCVSVGSRLYLEKLPAITGAVDIRVGDDVTISGALRIAAGRVFDRSTVIIADRVYLGHQVCLEVSSGITIEQGAWVAAGTSISDNDGHPLDPDARLRGLPPRPWEVSPVLIGRNAWIGRGCRILKGVTIGEGAVVGAGSVVLSDVPPFAVAIGNPARVVRSLTGGHSRAFGEAAR